MNTPRRLRALAAGLLAFSPGGPALAGEPPALREEEPVVVLEDHGEGLYHLAGTFEVPVPVSVAWEVLTDYGHIGEFVPTVRESEVLEREGTGVLLRQVFSGSFLFFTRTARVRLRVEEKEPGLIRFRDVAGRDFHRYEGIWKIEPAPGGARVYYGLEAQPDFQVPGFLLKAQLTEGVRGLLKGVRNEMNRRWERVETRRGERPRPAWQTEDGDPGTGGEPWRARRGEENAAPQEPADSKKLLPDPETALPPQGTMKVTR